MWCDVCAYVYMWNKCSTICRKSNEFTIIQRRLRRYMKSKQKRNNNTYAIIFFLLECPAGRYGESCYDTCGDQCQGCNRFSGICDLGCLPGWAGQRCDEPCKFGNNKFRYDVLNIFLQFLYFFDVSFFLRWFCLIHWFITFLCFYRIAVYFIRIWKAW